MDTAQLLGSLGDFVGAIVVAVTLIYLSVQLRQNTVFPAEFVAFVDEHIRDAPGIDDSALASWVNRDK